MNISRVPARARYCSGSSLLQPSPGTLSQPLRAPGWRPAMLVRASALTGRVDQLLSRYGYCSRREAKDWLRAGRVRCALFPSLPPSRPPPPLLCLVCASLPAPASAVSRRPGCCVIRWGGVKSQPAAAPVRQRPSPKQSPARFCTCRIGQTVVRTPDTKADPFVVLVDGPSRIR